MFNIPSTPFFGDGNSIFIEMGFYNRAPCYVQRWKTAYGNKE